MTNISAQPNSLQPAAEMAVDLFDNWFDSIETEVRARAREFIEELIRGELDAVLVRPRYGRSRMAGSEERAGVAGHRHGSQTRSLTGTFGPVEIACWRPALHLHPSAAKPVAQCPHHKFDGTIARGVQAKDQDADRAAVGRYGRDVVLGAARFRPDQHAQS